MKTYKNLYNQVYSHKNLLRAYNETKKGKTELYYVINFTKNLKENILQLQKELITQTYKPSSLTSFIIRDPKLRTISRSTFRDRIIHHSIVQILEPIFNPVFIFDSYANRLNKGTTKSLERIDYFLRKITENNQHSSTRARK